MSKAKTIATIGSHSALDICRGAKDEGFNTLVIVEKGRDQTYAKHFKTSGGLGCVDEVLYVDKFKDILKADFIKILKKKDVIFIPHRSFEVYVNNYDAIENEFDVPIFGNKKLLRIEERTERPNQYDLLKAAKINFPTIFDNFQQIDRLSIVKVPEKDRKFERAFFLADSSGGYQHTSERLISEGKIDREALEKATIEELVLGVQINFNFFYSTLTERLELVGTDTRRQTNIDGLLRLTSNLQQRAMEDHKVEAKYEEAGHIAVTTLESLLEPAFEMGERFVKTARELFTPGVIGPFSLQSIITAGPPKKEIVVFDVSPRMPGSPGIFATPYSGYLYGKSISMGRRVAQEIKLAAEKNKISQITT
ncbi:MAG: DUF1297 domain-containing protein [Candidatus Curtissbacteria bacterium]